jgi:hypothetical protein
MKNTFRFGLPHQMARAAAAVLLPGSVRRACGWRGGAAAGRFGRRSDRLASRVEPSRSAKDTLRSEDCGGSLPRCSGFCGAVGGPFLRQPGDRRSPIDFTTPHLRRLRSCCGRPLSSGIGPRRSLLPTASTGLPRRAASDRIARLQETKALPSGDSARPHQPARHHTI